MTERERLIELLQRKSCIYVPCDGDCGGCKNVEMFDDGIESIADYLLANGVIVLPCAVGTKVFFVYETDNETMFIDEGTIQSFSLDECGVWFMATYEHLSSYWHTALSIGETVFLTKEEAEKALKERSEK